MKNFQKNLIQVSDRTFIIIVAAIIIFLLIVNPFRHQSEDNNLILEKINKIENKIDSLSTKRDSIKTIIINVDKEIENNEKNYEKVVDIIVNNNDSANRVFIESYIKDYIRKISE